MGRNQKKKVYQLQLNNIKESNDPTRLECTFIIIDFELSHNNTIIYKADALSSLAPSILNKPIVTKYNRVEEPNDGTDHLEGHNTYISESRDGDLQIEMNTTPIGVFTSEGYVVTIPTEKGNKEVLAADAILWRDRFPDACDLLIEWYEKGININTSCEILYQNYSIINGVERIQSPIYFSGHCILNSEKRGEHDVVLPAYESSKLLSFNEINKFNRLVAQAINQEQESKEVKNMEEKELMQEELVEEVKEEQASEEVVENTPAEAKEEAVEPEKVEEPSEEAPVENEELKTLQNELAELKEKLSSMEVENKDLHEKFNTATEKLTQLNSQVEALKPFKDQVEAEKIEKALNEKKEFYSAKFTALNASEKFETEEVQELVKKAVFETDEGKEAILKLNSMLVEMVEVKTEVTNEPSQIKEFASKRENLIPEATDFDSRYGA